MAHEFSHKLSVQVEEIATGAVVRVRGSADMNEAATLRHRLEELTTKKCRWIILDLSAMDFISSEGLAGIILAHIRCRHVGGEVRIVSPQTRVLDVLVHTRLVMLFPPYASVQQAMPS